MPRVISKKLWDRIFPECSVPTFMLPTGPDIEDYVLVFDFDAMIDQLRSGIFVRPQIEVWAARESSYDLAHLGRVIEREFERQFNEAQSRIAAIQPDIDNLQSRQDELSDQIVRSAAGWTLLTITGPGLPWLLFQLWAGGTQRVRLIGLLKDFWGTRKEKNEAQRDLNRAIEELESDFESKSKALKKAVKSIEIRVHPRIRTVASMICEADGVAFSSDGPGPELDDIPDVEPHLRNPAYLKHLPESYYGLLNVR